MIMSFNDFAHKNKLKNKATSEKKFYQVLFSIGLDNVDKYLRYGLISSDTRGVNLQPTKGSYWILHENENFFDSFCCSPPRKLSKFMIKRNRCCLNSKCKNQSLTSKKDFYCPSIVYT